MENNNTVDVYNDLKHSYIETIQSLRYIVEGKDKYMRGHSDRVSEVAVLIGKYLNLSENDLQTLKVGGLFHDIGKIGVPDNILLKTTKLTNEEYSQIKYHPTIGVHILSDATIFQDLIPIVKHHHEKYDGTGYPDKLKGDMIPYLARITSVADTFDAMISKRVYRDALPLDVIKFELERCKGTQFDPKIADVFIDILNNHYDKVEEIQNKYMQFIL